MEPVMIPTLLFWENKNTWYGSKGNARFFIKPVTQQPLEGEEGEARQMLEIQLWRGPLTMALSEILTTAAFPMTEEGLEETTAWLEEQAAQLNG